MASESTPPDTTGPILIALGSNIDPRANLPAAIHLLNEHEYVRVVAASRAYESPAVDAQGAINPAQAPFLNAALRIETDLPPYDLKYSVLRVIEARLGRVRTGDKFAPRPIDLDIALYGGLVVDDAGSGITLPDPGVLRHAFLALPLADLAPNLRHPVTGERLADIAARLQAGAAVTLAPDLDLACAIRQHPADSGS